MTWLREIDTAFRTRLLTQGEERCGPWLGAVSDICALAASHWGLKQAGAARFGGASIVVPVQDRSERRAALKLISPLGDAEREYRSLRALADVAAVDAYDADLSHGALLLEYVTGTTLAEHVGLLGRDNAAAIAGEVARSIAGASAPADTPSLADGARSWLVQLQNQHEHALHHGNALPDPVLAAAVTGVQLLAQTPSETLTHGDLSFSNIMRRSNGEWVAIDPLMLAGPRENEAHTVARSCLNTLLNASDPAAAIASMNNNFCHAAEADTGLALIISHARFVASYYWEAQHQGDATNVANLRTATRYSHELAAVA
jgi:streptomycin 6-kinase